MLSKTLEDAKKMFAVYKLKFTYRFTDRPIYNGEKESVAGHTWGMMITADYLLEILEQVAP
jgi:5'-deoxynucleotidase YfbR-like HD superfamily hydrolase